MVSADQYVDDDGNDIEHNHDTEHFLIADAVDEGAGDAAADAEADVVGA